MVHFLIAIAMVLPHVVIHEAGHILAAYFVHSKVKRIGFSKVGFYVVREPASTGFKNAFVALAGPAANFYTWMFMASYHVHGASGPLVFGIMNLLPFPNSDLKKALQYIRTSEPADDLIASGIDL